MIGKMLDKIINDHVDKQDKLEEGLEKDIQSLINGLKINELMATPLDTLITAVEAVKAQLIDKYAPQAVKNGKEFADTIKGLKRDIVVEDTNDPKLSEEVDTDGEETT